MRASNYRASARFTLRSVGLLCLVIAMAVAMACGESGVSNPAAPSVVDGSQVSPPSTGDSASFSAQKRPLRIFYEVTFTGTTVANLTGPWAVLNDRRFEFA